MERHKDIMERHKDYQESLESLTSKVWMAEWSKALHLSCSLFGGVGSNPTPDNFFLTIYSKFN